MLIKDKQNRDTPREKMGVGILSKGGFASDSDGKESSCNMGDPGLISKSGRSLGRNDSPL